MAHLEDLSKRQKIVDHQKAAFFIQDIGEKLDLDQLCINTAIVYMHKFYAKYSFTDVNKYNLSVAALYIAAICNHCTLLEDLITTSHASLHKSSPALKVGTKEFDVQRSVVKDCIQILMREMGIHITIDHPHTYVGRVCELLEASKDVAQTSYFLATTSLLVTTMCVQYQPTVVACVCIHLACKWTCYEIEPNSEGMQWYNYVDKSITPDLLESLAAKLVMNLETYERKTGTKSMAVEGENCRRSESGDSFENKNIGIKEVSRVPAGDKPAPPKEGSNYGGKDTAGYSSKHQFSKTKSVPMREIQVPSSLKRRTIDTHGEKRKKVCLCVDKANSANQCKGENCRRSKSGDSFEKKNIGIKEVSCVPAGDKPAPPKEGSNYGGKDTAGYSSKHQFSKTKSVPMREIQVPSSLKRRTIDTHGEKRKKVCLCVDKANSTNQCKGENCHRSKSGDSFEKKNIGIKEVSCVPAGDKPAPPKERSNYGGKNAAGYSSKHQFSKTKFVPMKEMQAPSSTKRLTVDTHGTKRKKVCLGLRKSDSANQCKESSNHGGKDAAGYSSNHQFSKNKVVPMKKPSLVQQAPTPEQFFTVPEYLAAIRKVHLEQKPVPSSVTPSVQPKTQTTVENADHSTGSRACSGSLSDQATQFVQLGHSSYYWTLFGQASGLSFRPSVETNVDSEDTHDSEETNVRVPASTSNALDLCRVM